MACENTPMRGEGEGVHTAVRSRLTAIAVHVCLLTRTETLIKEKELKENNSRSLV